MDFMELKEGDHKPVHKLTVEPVEPVEPVELVEPTRLQQVVEGRGLRFLPGRLSGKAALSGDLQGVLRAGDGEGLLLHGACSLPWPVPASVWRSWEESGICLLLLEALDLTLLYSKRVKTWKGEGRVCQEMI